VYTNNYGAFGGSGISYGSDTFFGSVTINPSLFDISRCMFRMRTAITSFIIPSNSQLVAIGPCSIMGTGIESFTVPPQVKIVMYGAFDNLGNNQLPFYKLIFQTDFMVPFYGPDYNIDPNARPLGIV
jgi:hypothetical protein